MILVIAFQQGDRATFGRSAIPKNQECNSEKRLFFAGVQFRIDFLILA